MGANRPRHNTGRVVSKPAWAADRPRLLETSANSGDRLDKAGRKLSATRIRPSKSNQGPAHQRVVVLHHVIIGLGVNQQLFKFGCVLGFRVH